MFGTIRHGQLQSQTAESRGVLSTLVFLYTGYCHVKCRCPVGVHMCADKGRC